ncbi:SRPBCC family protein [Mycobacterium leprae]|nr:SRPBCC family protein [Mycobacterium leprae]
MAKLTGSIDVPLPPNEAWMCASDLARFGEWLTIHRAWRSKLPEVVEKGTVIESYVEVKGMPNRIRWTVVRYKAPEAMTLNGDGVGGVKVKLIAKVSPKDDGSVVSFDVHLGGSALFGPIGMIVAVALRTDIRESLQNFVTAFSRPEPGLIRSRALVVDQHSRAVVEQRSASAGL